MNAASRLASTNDLGEVLAQVIDALRDVLSAERASVFQYDALDHTLFATRAHGLPNDLRLPADLGIVGEAAKCRKIVNIPDAYSDERFNPAVDKATGFRTRCLLTIPLVDPDGALVGVAQVLNKSLDAGGVFTPEDEVLAGHLAAQAAIALKRSALLDAQIQKEKMEADLKIARSIQMSAMPKRLPTVPGYEIACRFEPADETGGDAFDVIDLGDLPRPGGDVDGHPGYQLFMGDATGHGVGAALSVVQVLAMIRMACRLHSALDDVAFHVNEQLCRDLPAGRFVTAFLGRLLPEKHELQWVSAGQAPLLFLKKGDVTPPDTLAMAANGMPFGIDEGFRTEPAAPFRFAEGDVLALLSDGYYETMNPEGKLFGVQRVVETLRAHQHESAEVMLSALLESLEAFNAGAGQDDDRTAVLIKRTAGS